MASRRSGGASWAGWRVASDLGPSRGRRRPGLDRLLGATGTGAGPSTMTEESANPHCPIWCSAVQQRADLDRHPHPEDLLATAGTWLLPPMSTTRPRAARPRPALRMASSGTSCARSAAHHFPQTAPRRSARTTRTRSASISTSAVVAMESRCFAWGLALSGRRGRYARGEGARLESGIDPIAFGGGAAPAQAQASTSRRIGQHSLRW